ncbi:MAG: hypothetical protein AAFX92_02200 [Pseudomonadota bacterium]
MTSRVLPNGPREEGSDAQLFAIGLLRLSLLAGVQATAEDLGGYPHRVEFDLAQEPLVCPIRSVGSFAWSDQAAGPGQASVPEGAAGAVLWTEGPGNATEAIGAMLWWEHPVHNPTTGEYIFPLAAHYTQNGGPVLLIQAAQRPASRQSENRASGTAAEIADGRPESVEAGVFRSTPNIGFDNDGIGWAVEIWATRQGSDGCSHRLATYTVHND